MGGLTSTDEDLDVIFLRLWQDCLQEVLGDESFTLRPSFGRLVQSVESAEALGVSVLELVQFLLQQDVILTDVSKHQCNLRLIIGVLEQLSNDLVHGCDASATTDHCDVVVLVGLIYWIFHDGTLDIKTLPGSHVVHVRTHRSVGVLLDDKVDAPFLIFNFNRPSATLH